MTIGAVTVTVTPDAAGAPGAPMDITCLLDEVSIHHGRDDTDGQPEAATATMGFDLTDPLPSTIDIGSRVTVVVRVAGVDSTRFTGRLTDIALGWDDAGQDTPNSGVGQLIATNTMADLGRRVVGDAPFPQELDGARVSRVLGLAGVTTDPGTSDPGQVQVVPRDVDAQAALGVAQSTAMSAGGMVWHTRDGAIRYADNVHRRRAASILELDACDLLVSPTWLRNLEGLINKVTVAYGVAPDGGEQPTVAGTNDKSIARFGVYDYSLTSELATLADAQSMIGLLLARNAAPIWGMPALPVDMAGLSATDTQTVLGLDVHNLITLTGLPTLAATPTTAHLFVEGWTERLAAGVHELELNVSGYCRTAPAPWWDDLTPAQTWDTIGTLTWDDAACLGPPLPGQRWTDVPASVRWNTVPASTTWNTWTPPPNREAA